VYEVMKVGVKLEWSHGCKYIYKDWKALSVENQHILKFGIAAQLTDWVLLSVGGIVYRYNYNRNYVFKRYNEAGIQVYGWYGDMSLAVEGHPYRKRIL